MPAFLYLGGDYGRGQLESALAVPQHTFDRHFVYRTIFDKAGALFRSLVKNHPLVDGNKRLALTSVAVFLTLNGYLFHVPPKEAVEFSRSVAGSGISWREISKWLRRNSIRADVFLRMSDDEAVAWFGLIKGALQYRQRLAKIAKDVRESSRT